MQEKKLFEPRCNIYSRMYKDPELNLLLQQVGPEAQPSKHAFVIAKKSPHHRKTPFKGTWKTEFDESNLKHRLVQSYLYTILSRHMSALAGNSREALDREIAKVREGLKFNEDWAKMVMINLQFFQEKYQEYVEAEHPETVVNLLERVDMSRVLTCAQQAAQNRSLLDRFVAWVRA